MKPYQHKEWNAIVAGSEKSLKGDCPLIEDEVIVEAAMEMQLMYEFINYIAMDFHESSHDKIKVQRDDYVRLAHKILDEFGY